MEYYRVTGDQMESLDFVTTAELLKAKLDEKTAPSDNETENLHFAAVKRALEEFQKETEKLQNTEYIQHRLSGTDRRTSEAIGFLRNYKRASEDEYFRDICNGLIQTLEQGVYQHLAKSIQQVEKQSCYSQNKQEQDRQLENLYNELIKGQENKPEKFKDTKTQIGNRSR